MLDIVSEAKDQLSDKPLLRTIKGTAVVAGDIHGDLDALETVIAKREELDAEYLILLGDYVDRGDEQVAVVKRIAQQVLDDNKFIPLRGNHEDILICSRYGFTNLLDQKNIDIKPVMEFFSHLPNAAVSDEIYMAHGGIPVVEGFTVDQINEFPRDIRIEHDLQLQIHWNDPIFDDNYGEVEKRASGRGPGIWHFGSSVTDEFFDNNDLSFILRAHIALLSGAKYMQDKRILSLFTSQGGPYRHHKRKISMLDLNQPTGIEIIDISKSD